MIAFGELIKYVLIPLANIPYRAKITKVIPIKMALNPIICRVGEIASAEIKSGKNAKKNIVSLGLRRLIKMPLNTI